MDSLLRSELVHATIDELLLSGQARSAHEAEEMFLDAHLSQIARLAMSWMMKRLSNMKRSSC